MTLYRYTFFFLFSFLLISCGDDDDCCVIPAEDIIINYDGDNVTAPNLPAGNYVFAMRLPATTINRLAGQSIKSVIVYMYNEPVDINMNIYNESNNLPGTVLYTQSMSGQVINNEWNTVNLSDPFEISGSALWVGFEVNLNNQLQTVGCDSGPASPNGDWLYDGADEEFIRFTNRVNDSVNWNIRVVIGE